MSIVKEFANSLDPDQCRHNESKPFDTIIVFLKGLFERLILKKKVSRRQQKHKKLPACKVKVVPSANIRIAFIISNWMEYAIDIK